MAVLATISVLLWQRQTSAASSPGRELSRSAWRGRQIVEELPASKRRVKGLRRGSAVAYEAGEGYKSESGQDKWANEHVFHGAGGGVFADLGCYDGVSYSNTWYFERVLNWTGVCVEPNPKVFPRIASQAGRTTGVQLAVSDHNGVAPFVTAYMRSSLNASAVDYKFLAKQNVRTGRVEVELVTPAALLSRHLPGVAHIDYVNIDVEQLEVRARTSSAPRSRRRHRVPRRATPTPRTPRAGAHLARVAVARGLCRRVQRRE